MKTSMQLKAGTFYAPSLDELRARAKGRFKVIKSRKQSHMTREQELAAARARQYTCHDPNFATPFQMPTDRKPAVFSHALPKYLLIDVIAGQSTIDRMSGMMIALGAHTLMADPETSGRGQFLVDVLKKASLSSAKRHMLEIVFARLGQKKFDATKRLVHNAGMIVDGSGMVIKLDSPMIARRRADLVSVEDLFGEVRKLHLVLDQAKRKAEAAAKANGHVRVADQKKAPAQGKPGNNQRPQKVKNHKPGRGNRGQKAHDDLVRQVHERLQAGD